MRRLLLAILPVIALGLSACGADNVKSCNDWKAKVACGSVSPDAINCEAYANSTCDISDYFDCLADAYVCENGSYNTEKLQTASACASKATCN